MEYIQVSIIDPWNIFYISADNELQKSKVTMLIVMDITANMISVSIEINISVYFSVASSDPS